MKDIAKSMQTSLIKRNKNPETDATAKVWRGTRKKTKEQATATTKTTEKVTKSKAETITTK